MEAYKDLYEVFYKSSLHEKNYVANFTQVKTEQGDSQTILKQQELIRPCFFLRPPRGIAMAYLYHITLLNKFLHHKNLQLATCNKQVKGQSYPLSFLPAASLPGTATLRSLAINACL